MCKDYFIIILYYYNLLEVQKVEDDNLQVELKVEYDNLQVELKVEDNNYII
jgi:hypothetical protein